VKCKFKVLIVEDSEDDALLLISELKKGGYLAEWQRVYTAEDLISALDGEPWDVVISDYVMPNFSGMAALGIFNERDLNIPFIMVSGKKGEECAVEAMKAGANDYILKGSYSRLVPCLRREIRDAKTRRERKLAEEELRRANQKIVEQHKAVIEEERLKVLLEIAGATAHELNQPLMGLLGNLDLMQMDRNDSEKLAEHMENVEAAAKRMSDIVKKMHDIRRYETKPYLGKYCIVNLDQKIKVLSVEDVDADFEALQRAFEDHSQIELSRATDIETAFAMMEASSFDLILLDHILPDGTSLDFLRRTKESENETPVIVITGRGEERTASRVINAGAYDYLVKDMVGEVSLCRSIDNTLEKCRLKNEIKTAQNMMSEITSVDQLTGLSNRRHFEEALAHEVARAERYKTALALCLLDLDSFKHINETSGRNVGNLVLTEVAKILMECLRDSDFLCRFAGEEFAVILPSTELEEARVVCERFRKKISEHQFQTKTSRFHVTASTGLISISEFPVESPKKLIFLARKRLQKAKGVTEGAIKDSAAVSPSRPESSAG